MSRSCSPLTHTFRSKYQTPFGLGPRSCCSRRRLRPPHFCLQRETISLLNSRSCRVVCRRFSRSLMQAPMLARVLNCCNGWKINITQCSARRRPTLSLSHPFFSRESRSLAPLGDDVARRRHENIKEKKFRWRQRRQFSSSSAGARTGGLPKERKPYDYDVIAECIFYSHFFFFHTWKR